MTRPELCIFGRISGSMRARMRIGAMFVLRQRLWLGNGGVVSCLRWAAFRIANSLRARSVVRLHAASQRHAFA
jgi:hypothetical protein